jgi:hypothetical protein
MGAEHQTTTSQAESLRLEPGAHRSPRDGVCVVELASILAGEEFSDRPECVDQPIAAFLRSWNDRASHVDRQRLRPYAERIVGSRAGPALTAGRRDICLGFAGAELGRGGVRDSLARLRVRARIALVLGLRPALRLSEGAGEYAARLCFSRRDSDAAFGLLDRMLELGTPNRRDNSRLAIYVLARQRLRGGDGVETSASGLSLNGNGNGNGHAHANGNGTHANGNGNGNHGARRRAVSPTRSKT